MNIGSACNKSIRAARMSKEAQDEIINYCNAYAQKLTGNPSFEFDSLPDQIVEPVFYGSGMTPEGGWAKFLKAEVRREIARLF